MKISIRLLSALVLALTVTACKTVAEQEIKGRDITAKGTVQVLFGTLKADGHEWVLATSDGDYELHLGPEEYRKSKAFVITDGEKANVRGFVFQKHISPVSIETVSSTIQLRTEDGKSLWAKTSFSSKAQTTREP